MTTDNPQVPWTDEQWARVNKAVQEEASRVRIAATFLPLLGPLPGDTDFVRKELILPDAITIQDRDVIQLATLQVRVTVRGAQMADPEMTSVLALFRRAASVLARLEDAVVFRGLEEDLAYNAKYSGQERFAPPIDVGPPFPNRVWEITGGQKSRGLLTTSVAVQAPQVNIQSQKSDRDAKLVSGIADAIGHLEKQGHFGPFAVVLDQALFLVAQSPTEALVLPQDRILPFLGGGPLLRSSTLDVAPNLRSGVVVALGGEPVELVIATDLCVQFLQVTDEPNFVFRVCEKMALRIKESEAIMPLRALP